MDCAMPWIQNLPQTEIMGNLSIKDLTVSFQSRGEMIQAVEGIDLEISPGEIVGLVGESGSGKSVTCNAILQLLPSPPAHVEKGAIRWSGNNLLKHTETVMQKIRGREISMVFQDPMSCLNPYLPVLDQVAEPLLIHKLCGQEEAKKKALEMLLKVGVHRIKEYPNSYPHEFSGGMRQRAMIAMALITQPSLLLADEPTTALDVTVQAKVLRILRELCSDLKVSVIFVSHDLGLVAELADRVVVMYRGKVVEQNTTASIFSNPQHPYVKALIACRPTLDNKFDRLPTVDDFLNPASGPHSKPSGRPHTNKSLDTSSKLLEAKNIVVEFSSPKQSIRAVNDVSISILQGTTHGLVGESGSGKTTLGRTLLSLIRKTSGEIMFKGKPVDANEKHNELNLRKSIQIIFQDPYASLNPRLTIEQTLLEPLIVHQIGNSHKDRVIRIIALLEEVGLGKEHLSRYPHEFSGGQRQRICVARALTTEPEFIVCDECVSAMDVSVQAQVLNLLKSLQKSRGLTYLFISHDLGVVKFMSDEISVMQNGKIVENGSADSIYKSPQTEYTRQLINSIPAANKSAHFTY